MLAPKQQNEQAQQGPAPNIQPLQQADSSSSWGAQPQSTQSAQSSQSQSGNIQVTQLSLPKGGGAIQGIGETFQADEFSGTASFSVPLPSSPARGFEPQIALNYSSGAGNGPFGLGWNAALPSVSRKTNKGQPLYNDKDTFILSNAEDLVPVDNSEQTHTVDGISYTVRRYRPRVEIAFARIEFWQAQANSQSFWRAITGDNITSVFGYDEESRIVDPEQPSHVFQWLLTFSYDAHGNATHYRYKAENDESLPNACYELNRSHTAQKYIQRLCYGNALPIVIEEFPTNLSLIKQAQWHFELVFDYGERQSAFAEDGSIVKGKDPYDSSEPWLARQDAFSRYESGFEIRTHRLCRNVVLFHRFEELDPKTDKLASAKPRLMQRLHLHYHENASLTRLLQVQSTGYSYQLTTETYLRKSLPPLLFGYTEFEPLGHCFGQLKQENNQLFTDLEGSGYRLLDVYGEGIPGVLYLDGESALFSEAMSRSDQEKDDSSKANHQTYGKPRVLGKLPINHLTEGPNARLMDLTGNGQLDWVSAKGDTVGYYEGRAVAASEKPREGAWEAFRPFEASPTEFSHPQAELIDATGDGLADVVLMDQEQVKVYPSRGKQGFDRAYAPLREKDMPSSIASSGKELLQFVDLLGTGRQHRVRLRNGCVECWPNLGYGRFGKKIVLQNAPDFGLYFDAQRLFLVDIDGSGTADIAYVHSDRVDIYLNNSGNSFSKKPISIRLPARWDQLDQVSFADVRGNGTTCLVFIQRDPQPRQYFYDFCQGKKPYLLNKRVNNMGSETHLSYESSTYFYLKDKEAGRPWLTALPMPIQVVAKVSTKDLISNNSLVQTYSYHHGYYDEALKEREFRGFGRVERQDTESFTDKGADKPEQYVAPARSVTWYHTGAPDQNTLSEQYRQEYYNGDKAAAVLPDSTVDYGAGESSFSATEQETLREAQRALKGSILRQELYGLDESEKSDHPYSVSENRFHLVQLQARGENRYAVFFSHPKESLSYSYERNPEDPLFSHELVLKVNEQYGRVVQTAQIAYGRRGSITASGELDAAALAEQQRMKVTSAIERHINKTFTSPGQPSHQIGLPKESLTYEILGLVAPSGDSEILSYETVKQHLCSSDPETSLPFAESVTYQCWGWQRQYYIGAGATQALSLGQVDAQALVSHSEAITFDKQQIENAPEGFKTALEDANKSGYEKHEGYYWNPRLKQQYHSVNSGTGDQASYFCQPKQVSDPFGNTTSYNAYDPHWLLLVQTTDALDNTFKAQDIDYGFLQARKLIDLNDNVSEVRFDPLGQVYVSSFSGTENGQTVGFDSLGTYTPLQPTDSATVIANASDYLQKAASYFYYDLFAWQNRKEPVHAVQLMAESYPDSGKPTRIPISIGYSDGFGRELQAKTLVEAGQAFSVAAEGSVQTITLEEGSSKQRWLSSNRVVYNNKGNPVKQYEPYYSDTFEFIDNQELNTFGVSPTLHYDPLGRVIRVDTPKGFFTKVEFDPWSQRSYDENDTVKDSKYYKDNIDNSNSPAAEKTALQKAEVCYGTYAESVLDNLGRRIRSIERTRAQVDDPITMIIEYFTYDIVGNQLTSADARLHAANKKNFQTTYNLANQPIQTISADAGTSWVLSNVMGNPVYRKSARGIETTISYDTLQRPLSQHVTGKDGQENLKHTVSRTIYGESLNDVAAAQAKNLRGQVYQHYDSSGLSQVQSYSLHGQPLSSRRQLRTAYKTEANWPTSESDRTALLNSEVFTYATSYDALGRPIQEIDADSNIREPEYHISGRLNKLKVQPQGEANLSEYVQGISYNAKGQRESILYGNNVTTSYTYEVETFRLMHLQSKRKDQTLLQNLNYTYDPVGNITELSDKAWNTVFNKNQQVHPKSEYTYSAFYTLIEARGREHPHFGQKGKQQSGDFGNIPSLPGINDSVALENYTCTYSYDFAGNLTNIHHAGSADWNRTLVVSRHNNRAIEQNNSSSILPGDVDNSFDPAGNQTAMDGVQALHWNYRDHLAHVEKTDTLHEYYVYDSSGQRVRKVTEDTTASTVHLNETIYLGGLEIHRKHKGSIGDSPTEERHTLRINDDERQVANREYWKVGSPPSGVSNPQVRYQLENHLGSASMEVNASGALISYEEYFPYGGTSFVAGKNLAEVSLKRYRYSGKERDSVTGFYYYGMRYYAPWIGRWLSVDPAGTVDGLNLYAFVRGNPLSKLDPTGMSRENPHDEQHLLREQSTAPSRAAPTPLDMHLKHGQKVAKGRPSGFETAADIGLDSVSTIGAVIESYSGTILSHSATKIATIAAQISNAIPAFRIMSALIRNSRTKAGETFRWSTALARTAVESVPYVLQIGGNAMMIVAGSEFLTGPACPEPELTATDATAAPAEANSWIPTLQLGLWSGGAAISAVGQIWGTVSHIKGFRDRKKENEQEAREWHIAGREHYTLRPLGEESRVYIEETVLEETKLQELTKLQESQGVPKGYPIRWVPLRNTSIRVVQGSETHRRRQQQEGTAMGESNV